MKASIRPVVAYVAGRLVSDTNASSVYDYDRGRHVNMSGTVSNQQVNVYDYDRGCHFGGSGNGGHFSLYHYGDGHHVNLDLEADGRFRGYDYGSGSHFNGKVNGRSISLYDYDTAQYYSFSV